MAKAFDQLSGAFDGALRAMFRLETVLAFVDGGLVQARAGEKGGIFSGMRFRVIRHEKVTRGVMEGTVNREIGTVEVRDATQDSCEAVAVRQFDAFRVGDVLVEDLSSGWTMAVLGGYQQRFWFAEARMDFRGYQAVGFGGAFQLGRLMDNQSDGVTGLGFNVFGRLQLINVGPIFLSATAGVGLLLGMRMDDALESATSLVVPLWVGPAIEWTLDPGISLWGEGRYVISTTMSSWDNIKDGRRQPATWLGIIPVVDPSGWQVLMGLKWRVF